MSRGVTQFMNVLQGLERKCLEAKVNDHGSASVVVTAQELDAIDEAIKAFDLEGVHPKVAQMLQEEYDARR